MSVHLYLFVLFEAFQCAFVAYFCLDQVVLVLEVDVAEVEVAIRVQRIDLQGLLVALNGFLRLLQSPQSDAQEKVCLGLLRTVLGDTQGLMVEEQGLLGQKQPYTDYMR